MKSYATIGKIQKGFFDCEVEMIRIEESKPYDIYKRTRIIEVRIKDNMLIKVWFALEKLQEGDIVVVEHDGYNVTKIYYKDDAEKKRRLQSVMR